MRLNISAWSIRQPVPAIVLFVVLTLLGIVSFMTLPVTRFPNIDVPIVSITVDAVGRGAGRARDAGHQEGRGRRRQHHRRQAHHVDASPTARRRRSSSSASRSTRTARSTTSRTRSPRSAPTCRAPSTSRSSSASTSRACRSSPIAASAPGMTLEQLSWFVDDVVKRAAAGREGRRPRRALRRRRPRDPRRARSRPAAGARHHRRRGQPRSCAPPTSTSAAAAARSAARSRRSARWPARARVEELADTKIVLPGGREVRLSDLGRVIDDASEQRSFARLDGEPVVAFSVFRSKGASELSVADVVDAKARRAAASSTPTSASPRSTTPSPTRAATTSPRWRR